MHNKKAPLNDNPNVQIVHELTGGYLQRLFTRKSSKNRAKQMHNKKAPLEWQP